jgi:hypothetical protein
VPARTGSRVWQTDCIWMPQMATQPMPTRSSRPNRVLVALAAAWIILSLAIGAVVSAGNAGPEAADTSITRAAQP